MQGAAKNTRGGRAGTNPDAPVPVLASAATKENVPVYFDGVGSSRALNIVTVRAQVDGKLIAVNFKEGQDVEKGFVLADIDPTIYRAQLDQAVAKKAMDEALLGNARIDLDRYAKLTATNSASRQQYDTQKALVAQLEAQVQADQGAIENAKAMLSYTRIVAPIAGRTGLRLIDAGNIVHATDTTGVVVITQIRPIAILFTLPQQELPAVNRAFAKGALDVEALADDNRTVVDHGKLVVVDNQVDQTTGTVKLKAEFPNQDLQLWPGQFVNVKLLVDTLKDATVVPTASVQRGPNGTFVYVANDDNTVSVRPVGVSQQDDVRAVLVDGVDTGERVVTTGFAQLNDGTRIAIGTAEKLERPAGSERRRKGQIPTADAEPKPAPPRPRHRRRRSRARARRRRCRCRGAGRVYCRVRDHQRHRSQPSGPPRPTGRHRARRRRSGDSRPMNVSAPFIARPIATSLLGVAVMLVRHAGLLAAPGGVAAPGRFPDHPSDDPASRRQCRDHGVARHRAAGAPVRPDSRALDHDVVVVVRHQPDHAAVRPQPRHRRRRAGPAVGDQRRRLDPAAQPSLSADLRQGEPGRCAGDDARADLADHRGAPDERPRRHHDRPAPERGHVASATSRCRAG